MVTDWGTPGIVVGGNPTGGGVAPIWSRVTIGGCNAPGLIAKVPGGNNSCSERFFRFLITVIRARNRIIEIIIGIRIKK